MKCENCNIDHNGEYATGRFCCKKCASAYSTKSKRSLINEKVSLKLKGRPGRVKPQSEIDAWCIRMNNPDVRKRAGKTRSKNSKTLLLELPFNELGKCQKRTRVLNEQKFACFECGIETWRGKKISLELDHVDGITSNNERSNLRALCPNCHSQTNTWRKKKSALMSKHNMRV